VLEELSTHEQVFHSHKMKGWGARPARSQKDQKVAFFSLKRGLTTITIHYTKYLRQIHAYK